jgi:hypothetical protein
MKHPNKKTQDLITAVLADDDFPLRGSKTAYFEWKH